MKSIKRDFLLDEINANQISGLLILWPRKDKAVGGMFRILSIFLAFLGIRGSAPVSTLGTLWVSQLFRWFFWGTAVRASYQDYLWKV